MPQHATLFGTITGAITPFIFVPLTASIINIAITATIGATVGFFVTLGWKLLFKWFQK